MRHPITIGALVLVALLFALGALLHLLVARRSTGARLLWAVLSLTLPLLGPLLYFTVGRERTDVEDDEAEDPGEERVFAPDPYVAPPRRAPLPTVASERPAPSPSTTAARASSPAPLPPPGSKAPPTITPREDLPLPRIAPIRVRAPLPPPGPDDAR